ncbi:hypothetical protein R3P38DRAFT_3540908 [Favolaschia claudopus]|uniref:Uncharacterized protein n=1 Tax=Favolaschia claudopus TaxID=2862362 RepID=A0AAW0B5P2_9AGAR
MVRVGGMSRPPTRQSRRLNGQSPSPPPPLPPQRSSRADSNALHSVNSVEPEHRHSDLYEVQNDMDVIQELPNVETSIPELNFDDWGGSPPGGALAVSLRPEDQATIDQFMSEPDLSFLENALSTSSSPLYPLAPISADPSPRENSYFNVSPHIHSPRARYPVSRTVSSTSSSLGFPLVIESTEASNVGHGSLESDFEQLFPPVSAPPVVPAVPPSRAGNGSLAHLRERERQRRTPAPTSVQPVLYRFAIYLGLPGENPAQCGFLELVNIAHAAPSLSDLIHVICEGNSSGAEMLRKICRDLDHTEYRIACSQRLIEVHDPTYSKLQNTYSEKGSLRGHLDRSTTTFAPKAAHTSASREIFEIHSVDQGTNFFVLYVFPHRSAALIISPPAPSPALTPAANSRPASRSTSRTPLSQSALTVQRGLFNVALFTAALDSHFRQEGHQLAMLMNSKNSDLQFGVGYTQIRQLLIIEDVITRASRMRIAIPNDLKITDSVPLWAGLNLSTYMNNRTYAKNARGTLIHLRNRKNANIVSALSAPDQQKENDLRRFLEVCFAPDLATVEMAESLSRAGFGSPTVMTIQTGVGQVKKRLALYQSGCQNFRNEPLTTVIVPVVQ